ncbi:MAG TPA: TatD family hydrolase, partial [Solirubrobacterales bacterium]
MIDSHTHLFLCEEPTAELLEAAGAAGVVRMLNVGLDETTNAEVVAVAEANEPVFAAVGRHPNDAGGFDDAAQAALVGLAGRAKVRAIGETGLDFYRD